MHFFKKIIFGVLVLVYCIELVEGSLSFSLTLSVYAGLHFSNKLFNEEELLFGNGRN